MDKKGYEAITQACAVAEIGAIVTPEPVEDENIRYLTIEIDTGVQPARVLNALGEAGLMRVAGPRDMGVRYGPELTPLGVQSGSLTLEDNGKVAYRRPV